MAAIANLMIVPLTDSTECIGKFLTDCGVTEVSCATACNNVAVRYRKSFLVNTEKLPDQPLQSISDNSFADLLADSNAKP